MMPLSSCPTSADAGDRQAKAQDSSLTPPAHARVAGDGDRRLSSGGAEGARARYGCRGRTVRTRTMWSRNSAMKFFRKSVVDSAAHASPAGQVSGVKLM